MTTVSETDIHRTWAHYRAIIDFEQRPTWRVPVIQSAGAVPLPSLSLATNAGSSEPMVTFERKNIRVIGNGVVVYDGE